MEAKVNMFTVKIRSLVTLWLDDSVHKGSCDMYMLCTWGMQTWWSIGQPHTTAPPSPRIIFMLIALLRREISSEIIEWGNH